MSERDYRAFYQVIYMYCYNYGNDSNIKAYEYEINFYHKDGSRHHTLMDVNENDDDIETWTFDTLLKSVRSLGNKSPAVFNSVNTVTNSIQFFQRESTESGFMLVDSFVFERENA